MENELSRVVDALPGLVWTALPTGQIDFLNQRWHEYTGLTREETAGQGWQQALHPDDAARVLESWQAILAAGVEGEMETRVRRFDGEYRRFLVRTSMLKDASGAIVKWCGMNTDIEDRVRAEAALRASVESEQRLRTIIDTIPATVWSSGPDGRTDFWNKRWQEYAGFAPTKTQDDWVKVIHPDDIERLWEVVGASIAAGQPGQVETRMRRFDGEYRWFLSRWEALRDAKGSIVSWYGANTDIDDAKRAEALLAGEKQLLEMVARGRPMPEILDAVCKFVESTASGCYCSVVLVDPTGSRLEHGAAPSLPPGFISAIIGRPVNVDAGPCAMASFLNEQIIAPDLRVETRWSAHEWSSMALAHGLQACWSTPINSSTGEVLGAFAIYYDEPRTPTAQQRRLIEQLMHIASIAVETAQSDATLKRSEAGFRAIVETSPECVKVVARDGKVLRVNTAGVAMAGASSAEMVIGQCFYDFLAPEHRERYTEFNERICAGEKDFLEFDIINLQGERRQMETHGAPMRDHDGSIVQLGVTRDITHRKQSEDRLRRSEAFLAEAQRLNSSGSFSWRQEPDEFTWSEQLYRIFGFDQSVPITLERISSRYHPEDIPVLSDMVARARGDGSDWEYEHRLLMPDLSIKHLHVVAHSIRHRDGRMEYVGAVQDVTERKLAESSLSKVSAQLAHVTRVTSLGALTASIAHEVNQPLSGIITNAGTCLRMLAADPPNVDGARETARRTIRDGNRASEVISRLRALFAKKDPAAESVDLNDATREVIALSLGELQRNRVVLQPDFAEDLPAVTGDRVQLQQVILNLLRNASDAMSQVEDRPRQLLIRTEVEEGDRVRLAVRDAGVGFELQAADKLFEAFYTTKDEGMGIGLSVSRTIIESHQGRLWAARNDGPGATFAFSIPRTRAH